MSDTDKTRPWTVKCLDDPSWLEESHDHRTGEPCDLPERPTKVATVFGDRTTSCNWVASRAFWVDRAAGGCGCASCTAQKERRAERRRSRHTSKIETRDERLAASARASVVDDYADVDIFDRMADPEDGFHDMVANYATIAARLGLPTTSLVVDIQMLGGPFNPDYDCCEDCSGCVDRDNAEYSIVHILHNDGTREQRRFDAPWDALDEAVATSDASGSVRSPRRTSYERRVRHYLLLARPPSHRAGG